MNSKQTLVVIGTAALCGLALAQTPPKAPSTPERLDALEREVHALRARADQVSPSTDVDIAELKRQLAETRTQVDQLIAWTTVQRDGAAELARVLDDSEQKGFTFGINPESRIVLLAGMREFLAAVQKDLPKPLELPAKGSKPARDVKPPR